MCHNFAEMKLTIVWQNVPTIQPCKPQWWTQRVLWAEFLLMSRLRKLAELNKAWPSCWPAPLVSGCCSFLSDYIGTVWPTSIHVHPHRTSTFWVLATPNFGQGILFCTPTATSTFAVGRHTNGAMLLWGLSRVRTSIRCAGGDVADNGVDQLIIDGAAMPVLKDMIQEGRSAGVQEGAVRLLTRLCSTPDAREQVSLCDLHTTVKPVMSA